MTILKPLCGAEPSLEENLSRFSQQSHENLSIVFGVADPNDPALQVALEFCRKHEAVKARVSIGEDTRLINPKVALLEKMSWFSDGDWVVVSDSNVRVTPGYVQDALWHAAPDVGLITHLVAGSGGRSLAAHLENLQLNCFVGPGVCGVRFIAGQTCVIGKSMFIRKDALAKIGGFESAGSFLAEDYVIGQAVEKAGFRVVTATLPIAAWHDGWTLSRFVNRHLRWAVMRRRVSKLAYAIELLLTPAPLLMLLLLLGILLPETGVRVAWVALALLAEQTTDAITFARMQGRPPPLVALLINPARQWLTVAVWCLGWFVQTIEWRGKPYRVMAGSALEPARALDGGVAHGA